MSKIEVNAIEPQSGTTLTIGASGDTVALAAGATSTGFGATYNGTVNWSSTIYSTDVTAVSGVGYFVNTISAPVTVTLPASPSFGNVVAVKDWGSNSATNRITIARNGSLIESNASDIYINNHGLATTLVYSGATKGWMVTDSGDASDLQLPAFISATGGTVLTCGNYKTHIFTANGCFVVSSIGNDLGSNSVEYMVVAGGAGGGYGRGGGGGAGGYRTNFPSPTTAGLPVAVTTYPISIGAGGAGSPIGVSGNNSIFSTITSTGGGNGGGEAGYQPSTGGSPGGSGGGAASPGTSGSGNTPPVSPSQGFPGGTVDNGNNLGKGGGGASTVGGSPTIPAPAQTLPAYGGRGSNWPNPAFGPTATSYGTPGPVADTRYFAGGGGGSGNCGEFGNGGSGGGGPGTGPPGSTGIAGTTNTGGGGGGGAGTASRGRGGAGGSGIVVIRYKYQ